LQFKLIWEKKMNLKVALAPALLALAFHSTSHATVVTYNDFSSTAGLTFVGNSSVATTADGQVLRVTRATGGQSGAVYSTTPITLGASDIFSTTFKFRFTDPGGIDPADGITFVLASNPTGLGGAGVGIGYAGVPHSVAIEFDTYNNAGFGLGNNDGSSSNHVAVDTNGNLNNLGITNVYGNGSCGFLSGSPSQNPYSVPGCMSNGDLWTASIGYDGSKLSVQLLDPAKGFVFNAIGGMPIDIASILGTNQAYVGFTSGTGAGWENHDIISWQFADTTELATVPEPATLSIVGVGLLGLLARRRRKA
jgi:hypothetical protein